MKRSEHSAVQSKHFGSKADMCSAQAHVRFTPKSGHVQCKRKWPQVPTVDIALIQ